LSCRLLYLIGQLGAGGSERQLFYLLKAMNRERYAPAVAVWNLSEFDSYLSQIRALDIPLFALANGCSKLKKLQTLRRLVKEAKAEVVHSYTSFTNFAAWCTTVGTKAVPVGSVRSDFISARKDNGLLLGRLSYRWPRSQVFNNLAAANAAGSSRSIFVPRQRFVVRNGLDLELFRFTSPSASTKARIVGIGSLLPAKRWDRLLVAARELKSKGLDFSMRLVGDGPLRASLQQQVCDLRLNDRVELTGHAVDVATLLSDATFLVHTSDSEGLPNAVMEAMACGRAVVATSVGDVPTVVEAGLTGFLVARGDDACLVERMATLIIDRNLCQRMGEAGRAKAEREFGLDRLVTETLAAYRAAGWKGMTIPRTPLLF